MPKYWPPRKAGVRGTPGGSIVAEDGPTTVVDGEGSRGQGEYNVVHMPLRYPRCNGDLLPLRRAGSQRTKREKSTGICADEHNCTVVQACEGRYEITGGIADHASNLLPGQLAAVFLLTDHLLGRASLGDPCSATIFLPLLEQLSWANPFYYCRCLGNDLSRAYRCSEMTQAATPAASLL